MKQLLFDLLHAQPVGDTKFHGGGEYIKSVFQLLAQTVDCSSLIVCYDTMLFIDDWILKILKEKNIKTHDVKNVSDIVNVLEQYADHPINFFTGMIYAYHGPWSFPSNVKTIGTCHGLRVLEKPYDAETWRYVSTIRAVKEFIKFTILNKKYTNKAIASAENYLAKFDVVVTVSKYSAYSMQLNLPHVMNEKEILVYNTPAKFVQLASAQLSTEEPYIMMVSANRWLKNSYRGVMAIDGLYDKGLLSGVKTKVFGALPEKIVKRLKHPEQFELHGYVSGEELEQAYHDCAVFFYPTLNEGFGLPPLEAMKYGKTCVISGVCSLLEVYGQSVYYCNPYDMMEMQNRLLNALEEPKEEDFLRSHVNYIINKQENDLKELCKIIGT